MEHKKSKPSYGQLDGRHTIFYQYEFPRATRNKGKYLPQGSVRLREFLYADGKHGQVVQIILIPPDKLGKGSEQRALVDKMLDLNREDKKFREGMLTSLELSGEIREYAGKKLICLSEILTNQEKIGLFASARRVKDSKRRLRRAKYWKIRIQVAMASALFISGLASGGLMQKYGFFDLEENAFFQNYVVGSVNTVKEIIKDISR
ncbi:MAG: hypothetical protein QM483_06080 [Desulfuromusa sp.]